MPQAYCHSPTDVEVGRSLGGGEKDSSWFSGCSFNIEDRLFKRSCRMLPVHRWVEATRGSWVSVLYAVGHSNALWIEMKDYDIINAFHACFCTRCKVQLQLRVKAFILKGSTTRKAWMSCCRQNQISKWGLFKVSHTPIPPRLLTEGKRRAGMGKPFAVGGPSLHVAGGVASSGSWRPEELR